MSTEPVQVREDDPPDAEEHLKRVKAEAPWWAQMGYNVLSVYGPVIVIMGVMLGMWAGWVPSPITQNREGIGRLEVGLLNQSLALKTAVESMSKEVEVSRKSDSRMIRIFQMICTRVSSDKAQVAECNNWNN
jgi:hypothetical protein